MRQIKRTYVKEIKIEIGVNVKVHDRIIKGTFPTVLRSTENLGTKISIKGRALKVET